MPEWLFIRKPLLCQNLSRPPSAVASRPGRRPRTPNVSSRCVRLFLLIQYVGLRGPMTLEPMDPQVFHLFLTTVNRIRIQNPVLPQLPIGDSATIQSAQSLPPD